MALLNKILNTNKWFRLIVILAIFGLLVLSLSYLNQSKVQIKEGFTSKCTYSKDQAKKDIKTEKDDATKKIAKCSKCKKDHSSDDQAGKCGSGCSDLLPVLDPMYNMREMCKQIILLEDHLFQKQKRCHDCICKHFLTIEALAEEAVTLDKDHKYTKELSDLPQKIRGIARKYIKNHEDAKQPSVTAQELRGIRKGVMQKCFKHF